MPEPAPPSGATTAWPGFAWPEGYPVAERAATGTRAADLGRRPSRWDETSKATRARDRTETRPSLNLLPGEFGCPDLATGRPSRALAYEEDPLADTEPGTRRSDHSPWNWLLILPIVVPLLTFLFNRDTPRLAGFPFFYWAQFAFIII